MKVLGFLRWLMGQDEYIPNIVLPELPGVGFVDFPAACLVCHDSTTHQREPAFTGISWCTGCRVVKFLA